MKVSNKKTIRRRSLNGLFAKAINNSSVVFEETQGYARQLVTGGRRTGYNDSNTMNTIKGMSIIEVIS